MICNMDQYGFLSLGIFSNSMFIPSWKDIHGTMNTKTLIFRGTFPVSVLHNKFSTTVNIVWMKIVCFRQGTDIHQQGHAILGHDRAWTTQSGHCTAAVGVQISFFLLSEKHLIWGEHHMNNPFFVHATRPQFAQDLCTYWTPCLSIKGFKYSTESWHGTKKWRCGRWFSVSRWVIFRFKMLVFGGVNRFKACLSQAETCKHQAPKTKEVVRVIRLVLENNVIEQQGISQILARTKTL